MAVPFFVDRIEDLADADTLVSMSGLAFMRAILAGELAMPPIARAMNFRLETVEPGTTTFRGAPGFDHLNPMKTVHGGWYGALLDSAMGCAVMTKVPKGSVYTTLEFKTNMIKQIAVGAEVTCTGRVLHSGRTTAIAEGQILGLQDDVLYAAATTTCIIMAVDPPDKAS
ncbi:MAG: PaaI family thioesterase [Pseudomonadota bacterium]